MTCVVGIVTDEGVLMAADSRYTWADQVLSDKAQKIFYLNNMLIGTCGDCRVENILHYQVQLEDAPKRKQMEWLVQVFVPKYRKLLKRHGASKAKNNLQSVDADIMIAIGKNLYTVYGDYCVGFMGNKPGDFAAMGSGEPYALGSLHSTEGLDPKERVTDAIKAAIRFNNGCGGKITYMSS